ncbi:tRNA (uracil-5-)-methyltransferase [Bryobacterales bacterium F-183]|nr:tRNA (uracil-5-)-methyltransferase [Bryobacterales bacterium F-183]
MLPGELVRLKSSKDRKGVLWSTPSEIMEPSPDRVTPRCPHFGTCGGCQYQHARYETQLDLKAGILVEQLQRMGKIDYEGEVEIIAGPEYGYRNRCQFQIENGKLGYFEQGGTELVPISECPIASPMIMLAIEKIRPLLPKFVSRFELFTNEREVQLNILRTERPLAKRFFEDCAKLVPGTDQPSIEYTAAGDTFRVNHKAFFQVNRFLVDELSAEVLKDESGDSAVDLYAGVGLFSVPLARKFKQVTSVETGAAAVADLKFNWKRAGLEGHAHCVRAEDWLTKATKTPDLVIADPPRTGLGKVAVQHLLRLKPRGITLISCNPSTLARDLAELKSAYEIAGLTLIDLFPQTHHLETVAKLQLR